MIEIILLALAIMAVAVLSVLADRFFKERRTITERLSSIEDQLKKRRHTYPTANGLEDAMAVVIELLLRQRAEDAYRDARLETLRSILGEVRESPLAYKDKGNDRSTR